MRNAEWPEIRNNVENVWEAMGECGTAGYFRAFSRRTGTSTLWRTVSAVLP
jgi:hypothetical protein